MESSSNTHPPTNSSFVHVCHGLKGYIKEKAKNIMNKCSQGKGISFVDSCYP